MFDLVFKYCILIFKNLKIKNLFERHINKNYFIKLFSTLQFLKPKNYNNFYMF